MQKRHGSALGATLLMMLLTCAVKPAHAAMVLTAAGTSAGFTLSTFASGFSSDGGGVGPVGITFPNSGGVLVTDFPSGSVYFFPTDTDGQSTASITPVTGFGTNNGAGLTNFNGTVYLAEQARGAIVQLTDTGSLVSTLTAGTPLATDLVGNSANGLLYVSHGGISAVNPTTKSVTSVLSGVASDGLTLDALNQILYAEVNGQIVGYNIGNASVAFQSGAISGADGAALGQGTLAGNLFVNTNFGQIVEVNLATKAQTVIATGGSRGDLIALDPNGTLLLTQTDSVIRLSPPSGGSFGGSATPEPATTALTLAGVTGLLGLARRRKKRSS